MKDQTEETDIQELQKYKEVIGSITDGLVALDEHWCYTFINERARQLLSRENSNELLGKNIWDTFSEIIGDELKDACILAFTEKRYVFHEQFFSKYNVWIENHIYPSAGGVVINFRDVTQRKTKEEAAHKIAERNTMVINNMRENFMLSDEQMNIVDVNPAFCQAIGYSREELLKMNVSDFYPELSYEQVKENFRNALESGQLLIDTRIPKKNGEIADVEVTHAKMQVDNRTLIASFGRDISAFKKAEQELKHSNERFELIGDITQDAVWEIEMDTGKKWANEMHQLMYGLQKTDPVPSSQEWEARIHPNDRETVLRGLDKAIKSGKNKWLAEYKFLTENRSWISIYDRTYIVRNKAGEPVTMLGSMLDITTLKEAEKQIVAEKKLSDTIINSLPGIFYLYSQTGKFIRWNKNFETVSKYNAADIEQLHPLDLFVGNEKDVVSKKIKEVFTNGAATVEALLVTRDGEKIPYFFTGLMAEFNGKPHLIGTGIDITDIKKAEAKVNAMKQQMLDQKVQEQKRISRAIINTQERERDHIGRELHDNVNQILAGTRLYLSMAGKKNPETNELVKYPMELLDKSISEIRLLTHKHATPPRDINLKDLVKTLLDKLSKNTGIRTRLEYDIDNSLLDDDLKINIYRVVQEQISNIIKHASPANAEISIVTEDDTLVVRIADDGKGFNVARRGEGIGISNIINRIDSFNGEVDVQSEPGKGCAIHIRIPLRNIEP